MNLVFIKNSFAGTDTANDVTYFLLVIILFLSLILALAYLFKAVRKFITHQIEGSSSGDEYLSENNIN